MTLREFCEAHQLPYPTENMKFHIRPARPEEAGLFYTPHPEEDKRLGTVGHVRMDFGRSGNEFWHTWWPRGPEELNLSLIHILTAPALETLFEQPNRFKTNGYRDFCFMRLMYDTAARCQELVDAKIHDLSIRKTHATICLTGKGNKLRIVPISPSVVELLKTYLDKAHPTEQRQSDDYLFFTTHHGRKSRMSTDAVNLFMKKYGEMARRACPEVPERCV